MQIFISRVLTIPASKSLELFQLMFAVHFDRTSFWREINVCNGGRDWDEEASRVVDGCFPIVLAWRQIDTYSVLFDLSSLP